MVEDRDGSELSRKYAKFFSFNLFTHILVSHGEHEV